MTTWWLTISIFWDALIEEANYAKSCSTTGKLINNRSTPFVIMLAPYQPCLLNNQKRGKCEWCV